LWTNSIGFNLGWTNWDDRLLFVDDVCQNYNGGMPYACTQSAKNSKIDDLGILEIYQFDEDLQQEKAKK